MEQHIPEAEQTILNQESVDRCQSFNDLLYLLRRTNGWANSSGYRVRYQEAEVIIKGLRRRDSRLNIDYVTSNYGLRSKVKQLLEKEQAPNQVLSRPEAEQTTSVEGTNRPFDVFKNNVVAHGEATREQVDRASVVSVTSLNLKNTNLGTLIVAQVEPSSDSQPSSGGERVGKPYQNYYDTFQTKLNLFNQGINGDVLYFWDSGHKRVLCIPVSVLEELRSSRSGSAERPSSTRVESPQVESPGKPSAGASSLSSPDHGNQDRYGVTETSSGCIAVVADGSGGGLQGTGYNQAKQDEMIGGNMEIFVNEVFEKHHTGMGLEGAMKAASEALKRNPNNPAYGTAAAVKVTPEGIEVVSSGDVGAIGVGRQKNQSSGLIRRLIGPRQDETLSLLNRLHNLPFSLQEAGQIELHEVDEHPQASSILQTVGGDDDKFESRKLRRTDYDFIIIMSDGAQPCTTVAEIGNRKQKNYQKKVQKIIGKLRAGKLTNEEASEQIAQAARVILQDRDDITVVIIDVRS
ncbi:MAG: hypothetical protein GF381_02700 [Candidatus Pacebacteria bacterium]|nr:hypothetical protein [Candidatus Paceibacterota bacterium]